MIISENNLLDYKKWKRKNVTIRGIKTPGEENGVYGSYGKGLYSVPLSNLKMAKEYGDPYFVINGIPKHPKIVNTLNDAEMFKQNVINNFCKKNNEKYSFKFFDENTSFEKEMLELGYDGLIIKGREMVNYMPKNFKYFRTENGLIDYYFNLREEIIEKLYIKYKNKQLIEVINEKLTVFNLNDVLSNGCGDILYIGIKKLNDYHLLYTYVTNFYSYSHHITNHMVYKWLLSYFKNENVLYSFLKSLGFKKIVKFKNINENIDPKSRYNDFENLELMINHERDICTVNIDSNSEKKLKIIKENNFNILRIPSNPYKMYVVFREHLRHNAEKLVKIAEKYGGFFSYKATDEDTIKIGRLLGYSEDNIQSFIKKRNEKNVNT